MKIAISQKVIVNERGERLDSLEQAYVNFFCGFGVSLIPVPNATCDVPAYLDEISVDRIIISGGNSLSPDVKSGELLVEDRDKTERALLDYAVKKNISVLGICRGAQFINLYFGGGLLKNIKTCLNGEVGHVAKRHKVLVTGGILKKLDISGEFEVNSYHNDGFTKKELSPELLAFALAEDGIVEGFCHGSKDVIGIVWHPERDGIGLTNPSKDIVDFFINKK